MIESHFAVILIFQSSANSKERLDSPSAVSCVGEEGKLLVKGELSHGH